MVVWKRSVAELKQHLQTTGPISLSSFDHRIVYRGLHVCFCQTSIRPCTWLATPHVFMIASEVQPTCKLFMCSRDTIEEPSHVAE